MILNDTHDSAMHVQQFGLLGMHYYIVYVFYQSSQTGSFFGQLKLSLKSREFAIVPKILAHFGACGSLYIRLIAAAFVERPHHHVP